MGTAIKHPVPEWVKLSFVLSIRVPRCQKLHKTTRSGTWCFIAVPIWHQWASMA